MNPARLTYLLLWLAAETAAAAGEEAKRGL